MTKINPSPALWIAPLLPIPLFIAQWQPSPWGPILCSLLLLALGTLPLINPTPTTSPTSTTSTPTSAYPTLLTLTLGLLLGGTLCLPRDFPDPHNWKREILTRLQAPPHNDIGQSAILATLLAQNGENPYSETVQPRSCVVDGKLTPWRPNLPDPLRGFHYGPGMLVALSPLTHINQNPQLDTTELLAIQTHTVQTPYGYPWLSQEAFQKTEQLLHLPPHPNPQKVVEKMREIYTSYRIQILLWTLGLLSLGCLIIATSPPTNNRLGRCLFFLACLTILTPQFFREYWLQAIVDPIPITLMLGGILAHRKNKPLLAGTLLGLSVSCKLGPGIFAVIPLIHKKTNPSTLIGLALGALAPTLPLLLDDPKGLLLNSTLATTQMDPHLSLASLLPPHLQKIPPAIGVLGVTALLIKNCLHHPTPTAHLKQTLLLTTLGVLAHKELHANHALWVCILSFLTCATQTPKTQIKKSCA